MFGAFLFLNVGGRFNMSNNDEYRFRLNSSIGKGTCPKCGHRGRFSFYYDYQRQSIIDSRCGRCDRIENIECQYHYTPSEYFKDHPGYFTNEKHEINDSNESNKSNESNDKLITDSLNDLEYLDKDYLRDSFFQFKPINPFLIFLKNIGLDDIEILRSVISKMNVLFLDDEDIAFMYEDLEGRWTRGKIMKYDRTGHRLKDEEGKYVKGSINSFHNIMKIDRALMPELHLYGLHLLNREENNNKSVAIVESEKSAVLANHYFPEMVWMATSGLSNLNYKRLKPLEDREIILYPDSGCFNLWRDKIEKENIKRFMDISINDTFEGAEFNKGYDIADYIVNEISSKK